LTGEYIFEIIISIALLIQPTKRNSGGGLMGTGNRFGQGIDAKFAVEATHFECGHCSNLGKTVFHSSVNSEDKFSCGECTNVFLDPVKYSRPPVTDLVCEGNPELTKYLRETYLQKKDGEKKK